jgi:hypothetical protein
MKKNRIVTKQNPHHQAAPVRPLAGAPLSAANKKKFVNKKKAKRYADQDDDEKELAMLALGAYICICM